MLLSMAFREQVKQTKDLAMKSEMTYGVSYPTGFLNMDFANGYIQEINGKMKFETRNLLLLSKLEPTTSK